MSTLVGRHRVVVESVEPGAVDPQARGAVVMTRTLTLWFDTPVDAERCYHKTPVPSPGVTVTLEREGSPEHWVVWQIKTFDTSGVASATVL